MNQLDFSPPTALRSFMGPEDTIREMVRAARGERGERSTLVRSMTEQVVHQLQPKDYLSELIAIRNWVASHVRYTNDSLTTEVVKDPQRMVEEILARGKAVGDCDDIGLLIATMVRQVGREAEYITVGFQGPKLWKRARQWDTNDFSHVFARALEPKSRQWIVLDPVAGTDEAKMLRRMTTWRAWRID